MLKKLYRWGPSPTVIRKSYVWVGPVPFRPSSYTAAKEDGSFRVVTRSVGDPVIRIESGPVWLHNASARKSFFQSLARTTSHLVGEAKRCGGFIIPCGIRVGNFRWDQILDSDLYGVETASLEEQTMYANLLRLFTD